MKKSITKLMAALLSVAMLVTMLPVVSLADSTAPAFEIGTGSNGTYDPASPAVTLAQVAEIGGKSDGDYAAAYVYNADTELASSVRWQWPLSHLTDIGTGGGTNPLYFAFNIYADGDATAVVGYGAGHKFLRWEPDGNLYVDKQGTETLWGTLERGKWHRVALSFNEDGGRFRYYVDGVYTGMNSGWGAITGKSTLNFCLWEGSGNGVVAFDDPTHQLQTKYSDVATTDAATIAAYADDYLKIDTDANHVEYDSLTYTTASALKTALQTATSAQYVELFADSSCAMALDDNYTITETATVVIVPSTGYRYSYYSVGARELTDMEKVDLFVLDDDADDPNDNWMENVVIDDDKVAVFSTSESKFNQITSDMVLSCLSSGNGYEFSYVDDEKTPSSTDDVRSGYVKASKDGEDDIYFAIVSKCNATVACEVTGGTLEKRGATLTSDTNVAGKPTTDTSSGFCVPSTSTWTYGKYYFSGDKITAENSMTKTYVFNMYADGNSVAAILPGTSYSPFIKWTASDGNFYPPLTKTSADTVPAANLAPGRWHQIAITFDKATGGGMLIYADGKRILNSEGVIPSWSDYTGLYLSLEHPSSETGNVLYDDIVQYNGFYDKTGEFVSSTTQTSDFTIDTDKRVIYYRNEESIADLTAAILDQTDASAATIFADDTFETAATTLDNANNIAVLTSPNGLRLEYYTLKDYSELPAPKFTFEHSTHVFNATADITKADETLTMYVASYNAENKLLAIQVATIPAGQNISKTVKCAYGDSDAAFVKAFLWTANQTPVGYGYSKVPASAE